MVRRIVGNTKLKLHDLAPSLATSIFSILSKVLNPALHLSRFGRVRPETIDEALFFGKHGQLPGKCCLLVLSRMLQGSEIAQKHLFVGD
jgi:hypothetical protein